MKTLVTDWLRQLSRAVSTRQLYPAEHPRVVEAVAVVSELSDRLTSDGAEVSVFMLEGRLACNGALVPGVDSAATRVFELIQAHGCDRVTLRRGVERSELGQLVSVLAAKDPPAQEDRRLRSTAHVRFSVFEVGSRGPAAAPVGEARLSDLWDRIDQQHTLDGDALEMLLAPLAQVADSRETAMLPLATLRNHDDYTATHIANVAVLAMALGDRVGLPPAFVRQVGIAALLHDIGKLKVPTDILNQPGKLTPDQLTLIRRHPEVGAEMLMRTPGVPQLAVIVAYEHHLQADGGGYPEVPRGWHIHLASTITHIADVYDALRSNRPYRAGWPHEQIVEAMTQDRGHVFPSALVNVFLEEVAPRARPVEPDPALPHSADDCFLLPPLRREADESGA